MWPSLSRLWVYLPLINFERTEIKDVCEPSALLLTLQPGCKTSGGVCVAVSKSSVQRTSRIVWLTGWVCPWMDGLIRAWHQSWKSWCIYLHASLSVYLCVSPEYVRLSTKYILYQWFPESLAVWRSLSCRTESPPERSHRTTNGSPATETCRGVSSCFFFSFQSKKLIGEMGCWQGRHGRGSVWNMTARCMC